MTKRILDNGKEIYGSGWVSRTVYAAFRAQKPWDADNFVNVQVYPYYVWMTKAEAKRLSYLADPDDIKDYLSQLDVQVVPPEAFDRWRKGQ